MRKIRILLSLMLTLLISVANAQTRQITGVVTSAEDGATIPGVSVMVKGNTTLGSVTDIDGKYQLRVPQDSRVLVFSMVGMEKQEIPIGSSGVINAVLKPEITALDEVVVIGYGTQIKSKVTGNISKVNGDVIKNTPVPTVQQAMQGKSAGVFVEAVNGKSSGITRMRINGMCI